MIQISLNDNISLPVQKEKIKTVLEIFLKTLNQSNKSLSLYITDNDEIQVLNKEYRQKDKPTDILSWSYYEEDKQSTMLGELAISIEQIIKQSKDNGWDVETELIRILAHGCVHLLGYDHERSKEEEEIMLKLEIQLLDNIGLPNLYPHSNSN